METVAMNFSTFRFVVALTSAAVFTGRTKVWRLCRSEGPQYHFAAIKVNPAETARPACHVDELVTSIAHEMREEYRRRRRPNESDASAVRCASKIRATRAPQEAHQKLHQR
jgi:hypothetical protein